MRLKTKIRSLGNTLSTLKQLDGKGYILKRDESKEKIGLLAQDVQKVLPQLVRKAGDDQGTLSLNYQGLIPVLINAVNEQQLIIEDLETRLDRQKMQIKNQQQQIDKLKVTIATLIKNE